MVELRADEGLHRAEKPGWSVSGIESSLEMKNLQLSKTTTTIIIKNLLQVLSKVWSWSFTGLRGTEKSIVKTRKNYEDWLSDHLSTTTREKLPKITKNRKDLLFYSHFLQRWQSCLLKKLLQKGYYSHCYYVVLSII